MSLQRCATRAHRRPAHPLHTRQAYNIGSGRATSIKDVCELCIDAMKTDLTMETKPARTFDFAVFVYDISKAQTLPNFEPKWNLSRGIKDILKQQCMHE